jgi:hypothetical protein
MGSNSLILELGVLLIYNCKYNISIIVSINRSIKYGRKHGKWTWKEEELERGMVNLTVDLKVFE